MDSACELGYRLGSQRYGAFSASMDSEPAFTRSLETTPFSSFFECKSVFVGWGEQLRIGFRQISRTYYLIKER